MPVIGTSGSTSGDGKRRVAAWPKRPRPSSTLPNATYEPRRVRNWESNGLNADVAFGPLMTQLRHWQNQKLLPKRRTD